MPTLLYNCISDQADTGSTGSSGLRFDPSFLGTWDSTNTDTAGIKRVELKDRDGHLFLHAYGADDETLNDWGEVEVNLFADRADSFLATKFQGFYDFGFMEIRIHAWVKLGVLVFAVFNRFKDGSGRVNYFDREFFAQPIR